MTLIIITYSNLRTGYRQIFLLNVRKNKKFRVDVINKCGWTAIISEAVSGCGFNNSVHCNNVVRVCVNM